MFGMGTIIMIVAIGIFVPVVSLIAAGYLGGRLNSEVEESKRHRYFE